MDSTPRPDADSPGVPGDDAPLPEGMDSEQARIYRQSQPKEPVTRDFLESLLEEHRANKKARP